jgi:MFS family permease
LSSDHPDAAVPVASPARPGWGGVFESLRIPKFRRYMLGYIGACVADSSFMVALGWLAFDLSDDASTLGAVLFTFGTCLSVSALVGGVVADRYDRAVTIVSMQSIVTGVAVALGVLVFTDHIELWHLFVAAALAGTTISLQYPAHIAFLYNLVGQKSLANAIAVNLGSNNATRLFTPAIAGILIGLWGVEAVYVMVVAGFVLSIVVVLTFVGSTTGGRSETTESPLTALTEGVRYLWGARPIFWIFVVLLLTSMFGFPYRDLLPAFAVDALDKGPEQYGIMLSMIGLGSIIGASMIAALTGARRKGTIVVVMAVALGGLIIALSFAGTLIVALVVLLIIGLATSFVTAMGSIIMQTNVAAPFRGRVASFHLLTFGMHPAGALLFGFLAEATDIRVAYRVSGLVLIGLIAIVGLWRGDVRRLS